MTPLHEKMKMDLELKGYSSSTQKAYIKSIERYAQYYCKSPEFLGTDEIRGYLHLLTTRSETSASTLGIVYSALRFLYETTLEQDWSIKKFPRMKRSTRLPVLMAPSEIKELFTVTVNPKHKAVLMTLYGAGLRASEVANLHVSDIDSKTMQIRVRQGKGKKDRYTLLSYENLKVLRQYWLLCRPVEWLFPGTSPDVPMTGNTVGRLFAKAKRLANIKRPVSPHTLRHCFATHLLEAGTSIYHIQHLLGHSNPRMTSIYIHLTRKDIFDVKSPLDNLMGMAYE